MPMQDEVTQLHVYAIRHKPTGKYIPRYMSSKATSGTHYEPMHCSVSSRLIPRLFHSEKAAISFITQWLRGRMHGEEDGGHTISLISSRKREELEIVLVQLNLNVERTLNSPDELEYI